MGRTLLLEEEEEAEGSGGGSRELYKAGHCYMRRWGDPQDKQPGGGTEEAVILSGVGGQASKKTGFGQRPEEMR